MIPLLATPVEISVGVSFSLLFGTVFASLVGCISFGVTSVADETVPGTAGGAITVAITGGALYAAGAVDLNTVQPGFLLGLGLAFVLGLYATSWGTRLAADLPRIIGGQVRRTQSLAADAIDAVDAMGQVTIRSSGGVREFDGYLPLDPGLRAALEDGAWRLPADLPLSELETRLEDALRTRYDFEAVSVSVDGRGRATITAAPPANGVAKQVPDGWRAVSVRALLPTGVAPGDEVLVTTDSDAVSGTVLSAATDTVADGSHADPNRGASDGVPNDDRSIAGGSTAPIPAAAVVTGGEGYVTVAVPTTDADVLLEADRARVVVTPRGVTHESDAILVLERGGTAVRRMTVTEAILDAVSDAATDLEVFAIRGTGTDDGESATDHEWQFEPDSEDIAIGMEAFLLDTDAAFEAELDERERPALEVSH